MILSWVETIYVQRTSVNSRVCAYIHMQPAFFPFSDGCFSIICIKKILYFDQDEFFLHLFTASCRHASIMTKEQWKGCEQKQRAVHFVEFLHKYSSIHSYKRKIMKKLLYYNYTVGLALWHSRHLSNMSANSSSTCFTFD